MSLHHYCRFVVVFLVAVVGGRAFGQFVPNGSSGSAKSDRWGPGLWMASAIDNVLESATVANATLGYALDSERVSLLGAFMEPKQTLSFTWTFSRGDRLLLIGGGDSDVRDLDLSFYGPDGDRLASDQDIDATPVLSMVIPKDGKYTVRMHLFYAAESSFCCVVLMTNRSKPMRLDVISQAVANYLDVARAVNDLSPAGADFELNVWSLWGSVMSSGETRSISGIPCSDSNYALLGATNDIENVDVDLVAMTSGGSEIGSDKLNDGVPLIHFRHSGSIRAEFTRADDLGSRCFGVFGVVLRP